MMDLDGGDRKGGIRKRRERRWRKIKKNKVATVPCCVTEVKH